MFGRMFVSASVLLQIVPEGPSRSAHSVSRIAAMELLSGDSAASASLAELQGSPALPFGTIAVSAAI